MKEITISKAKKADFEEIFSLLKQLWPKKRLNKSVSSKIFISDLRKKDKIILVVKKKSQIIGFGSLHIRTNFDYNKIALIEEIIISEEFRNKDIGKKILNELIKCAREEHCLEIELYCAFHRKKTHRFYIKNGLKKSAFYFHKKI